VALAFVRACGGDAADWEQRWTEAARGEAGLMARAVPPLRYSLPADTVAFTGRGGELGRITAAVKGAVGGVVTVGAIDGMPGAGKTTLAVHVAHALAGEFPDRQLFIDLHAHTPGHEPAKAEDALAGLLAAVGVDPGYLPRDINGRAAMWRDRMAGQRALLVLDNAASSGQVAPLLPGGGGCLVLVTSRRHLGDLPGAVTPILVDALPHEEAADMFTRLAPRAAGDRDRVAEVVRLAGFLPLAVCLLARVFARHSSWAMADLIAETRGGVLTMAAENDSVAAAFEVSYRHLHPASQRLFRLLGVHPGTVIDRYAAAALAGIEMVEAAGLLDGLHREGLVTEAGYRRYRMHDLLRRYARDLAVAAGPASDAEEALGRLLDYYQHTSALAGTHLARQARPGQGPSAPGGREIADLEEAGQALAWVRADRANLLACLDLAARTRQHSRVVALTAGLAAVLRRDGPWAEAVRCHAAAIEAARRAGDRLGEGNALTDLGDVLRLTGDYPGAARALQEAFGIYRDLDNRLGQANALTDLGFVQRLAGDYPGATAVLDEALGIYHDIGSRPGEANARAELGAVRRLTGDYPGATSLLEEALGIYSDLDDRLGQANALFHLGIVRLMTDDYPGAARVLEQALGICRDLDDRPGQANALTYLGIVRQVTGDLPGAASVLELALSICHELGSRLWEANAQCILGAVRQQAGDHPGAAVVLEQAVSIYRELGSRLGEANALSELGAVRRLMGDFRGAAGLLEAALDIYRDLGDQPGETETLNEQGTLHRACGDLTRAAQCHQQARDLAHTTGSSRDEACALAGLGRCSMTTGHTAQAKILLQQAYEIFQRIGAAETSVVLADLDALTRPGHPVSA
jgi:tetratricopeptide (TPR) repeat protein